MTHQAWSNSLPQGNGPNCGENRSEVKQAPSDLRMLALTGAESESRHVNCAVSKSDPEHKAADAQSEESR